MHSIEYIHYICIVFHNSLCFHSYSTLYFTILTIYTNTHIYSLVIATASHPLSILRECLPLLGPSSPVVIYCEYCEPLVECYLYMQSRGDCLRIRMSDTWCREYQTLPGRVHPVMYMPTSGGYVLTAIYVGGGAGAVTTTV